MPPFNNKTISIEKSVLQAFNNQTSVLKTLYCHTLIIKLYILKRIHCQLLIIKIYILLGTEKFHKTLIFYTSDLYTGQSQQ